ncbi:MAG: Ppx/GppA family phosphatase, partial [Polyangiaceae bacterium]|nr:Ppx/GppA family phosphatase [Polyangiaceae bacterium]
MATNVAAVDIGTNSVLLLVAAWDSASGELSALLERARITRLGRGVDRSRRLAPDAVERTLNCLAEFSELIRMHEVQHVDAVGTSAARDAEGAEEFLRAAESILGVRPHIINGQREAALTFEGALCGLDAAGAVVACDIGGGSTEIVLGERDSAGASRLQHAVSVDVGSVRLTERYLTDDPATAAQIGAARQDVRNELRRIERPPAGATFVGLAGTVTTLAAVKLGLERYDPARVHGVRLAAVD